MGAGAVQELSFPPLLAAIVLCLPLTQLSAVWGQRGSGKGELTNLLLAAAAADSVAGFAS